MGFFGRLVCSLSRRRAKSDAQSYRFCSAFARCTFWHVNGGTIDEVNADQAKYEDEGQGVPVLYAALSHAILAPDLGRSSWNKWKE